MDKKVMFAVAGAGKTSWIISELSLEKRALLVTYTTNNLNHLKLSLSRKFGYHPANISAMTYFHFLYSFCFRPLLARKTKVRGINWKTSPPQFATGDERYFDGYSRLYHGRIAKYLIEQGKSKDVIQRITKYFDKLYIDEVQDLGGNDFNLLKVLAHAPMDMLLVGDFFQHTFDTSRDGRVNTSLHNNYAEYCKQFTKMGFAIDKTILLKSHRCSPTICNFIQTELNINIESHQLEKTEVSLIIDPIQIQKIVEDDLIIKLFYQKHHIHDCYSRNWGESKGADHYLDVCVVLNKTTYSLFKKKMLHELAALTKNKLYVACSRARRNLYFIPEELLNLNTSKKIK